MPVPPNKLPDNLSAQEYQRLARLYSLMGNRDLSLQAAQAAAKLSSTPDKVDSATDEVTEKQMSLGVELVTTLLRYSMASSDQERGEIKAEIQKQIDEAGLPDDQRQALITGMNSALEQITHQSQPPPQEVPEDLTTSEYLELGKKYKDVGWTEQARDALNYAISLDPDGAVGSSAAAFLRSKIPRNPVPFVAIQDNIHGFNELYGGQVESARLTFEQLTIKYPDFEWPFGNLGYLHIMKGDFKSAQKVLRAALEINPFYISAWLHSARLFALEGDYNQALTCLDKVDSIDPSEDTIGLRQVIHELRET